MEFTDISNDELQTEVDEITGDEIQTEDDETPIHESHPEFEENPYVVYVQTNPHGYIIAVNSSAFLPDLTDWVEVDSGFGDKYHHAQGNYFDKPIMTMGGAYQYKLVDGTPVDCTAEEIKEQEEANKPNPSPVPSETSVWDELDAAYQEGVDSV